MKIEMIKAGPIGGIQKAIGDEVEIDEYTGVKLIKRGYAIEVKEKTSDGPPAGNKTTKPRKPKGPSKTAVKKGPAEKRDESGSGSEDGTEEKSDLAAMSRKELFKLAKDEGIKTEFRMDHDTLVDLIGGELDARAEAETDDEAEEQSGEGNEEPEDQVPAAGGGAEDGAGDEGNQAT